MANLVMSNSISFSTPIHLTRNYRPINTASFPVGSRKKSSRGISVVTRAGPSTSSYVFAFVLPFSLLAVTIFASIRVADKLDRKFLEEIAINQAILEGEDDESEVDISSEKEPTPVHNRNRPKREVESSSM